MIQAKKSLRYNQVQCPSTTYSWSLSLATEDLHTPYVKQIRRKSNTWFIVQYSN